MPIREIPKNYRNVTGVCSGLSKSVGSAQYESTLERDFIVLLDFSRDVRTYEVQPVSVDWFDENGKVHHYTPDMLVTFHPGRSDGSKPWLCEVKYRDDLARNWKEYRPKFKAAFRYASKHGWRYRIVTEREIRTPRFENARFLTRYLKAVQWKPDYSLAELLQKRLEEMREATPAALVEAVCFDETNRARLLPTLWYLIATLQIGVDLDRPLNMNSPIWWKP
jgi:hypothetical protein